ncbi:ABC transporter permease [Thalassoglobus sp. JC818]|uniref:ABC transporter permease n=1 Tax=Thalassoglobus sp. JC818 TaxID=3232136 RepID=UPI00345A0802
MKAFSQMQDRLLRSNFVANYGSVFVLILLCAYYSYMTYGEQQPISEAAGVEVGNTISDSIGPGGNVLIVIRNTVGDREFATALEKQLKKNQVEVLDTLSGSPADLRKAMEEIGAAGKSLGAIATHHAGAQFGPIRRESLDKLQETYPSLSGVEVFIPKSYYWPTFLTRENLLNVVNQNADVAIIAIGMTMVIITAGIDLSVGSILAVSAVVTAIALQSLGGANASVMTMAFCAFLGVFACLLCGLFNGVMVTFFRVPAFIVTLAAMMIARGVALILAVRYQSYLSGGTTEGTPEAIKITAQSFSTLGNGEFLSIPIPILLMLGLYALAHYVMSHTAFGRYLYAVGGNAEAARLSGVPVTAVLIAVYAICATMAGIGGVVDASRFEGGRPNAGELYELQVIAAVVVGGTSLAGGEGRIFGTLTGAMIIAVIQNGLNMAGVKSYEQKVVFGLLILGAVVIDQFKKRR